MKSILISIKPKWCALMMNRKKTIEVRKTKALANAIQKLIDEQGFADIYVYCTKGKKDYLYYDKDFGDYITLSQDFGKLNGKVVFKFRCYKVEEINYDHDDREEWYATKTLNDKKLEKQSCLTYEDLDDYLKGNGYAIHISDLVIFDEPKELSEFKQPRDSYGKVNWDTSDYYYTELTNAPQNFCYVEELE